MGKTFSGWNMTEAARQYHFQFFILLPRRIAGLEAWFELRRRICLLGFGPRLRAASRRFAWKF